MKAKIRNQKRSNSNNSGNKKGSKMKHNRKKKKSPKKNKIEIKDICDMLNTCRYDMGQITSKTKGYPIIKKRIKSLFGEEFPFCLVPTSDMFSSKQRSKEERNKEMEAKSLDDEYVRDWCYTNFGINQEFYTLGMEASYELDGFTRVYILYNGTGDKYDEYKVSSVFLSLPNLLMTLHNHESRYGNSDKPLELKFQEPGMIVYYSPRRGRNWMITSITALEHPDFSAFNYISEESKKGTIIKIEKD